MRNKKLKLIL